jgi:hypothetical protein
MKVITKTIDIAFCDPLSISPLQGERAFPLPCKGRVRVGSIIRLIRLETALKPILHVCSPVIAAELADFLCYQRSGN